MDNKDRFVIVEYLSLSLVCIGLIAAIKTQKLVYAVVPLSFNAYINLVRKQQIEQKLENISNVVVSPIDYGQQLIEIDDKVQGKRIKITY